jgi:hypothetical protein
MRWPWEEWKFFVNDSFALLICDPAYDECSDPGKYLCLYNSKVAVHASICSASFSSFAKGEMINRVIET